MLIGVPKEIKAGEYRVGISPVGVKELAYHGHQVLIEKNAGHAIGFSDSSYQNAGAVLAQSAAEVFERAEMIVKVKEPQVEECEMMHEEQVIFAYLHLAAEPHIASALSDSGAVAIAYETITNDDGDLPLLAPMSEIAGRVAVQSAAYFLQRTQGGRGVLLSGVPGVGSGKVTIIGGGTVGANAADLALGLGAEVTILDKSIEKIRNLSWRFGGKVNTVYSTIDSLYRHIVEADILIGAVLTPGSVADKLISKDFIKNMKLGSVFVDVAIDQGGCSQTSKATTHSEPTYIVEDVVHYCVTNMPSAVAHTATISLENSTLPYILRMADHGYKAVMREDKNILNGLNIYKGRITYEAIAKALNHPYVPPSSFLSCD